jgi:hypothetical protein
LRCPPRKLSLNLCGVVGCILLEFAVYCGVTTPFARQITVYIRLGCQFSRCAFYRRSFLYRRQVFAGFSHHALGFFQGTFIDGLTHFIDGGSTVFIKHWAKQRLSYIRLVLHAGIEGIFPAFDILLTTGEALSGWCGNVIGNLTP